MSPVKTLPHAILFVGWPDKYYGLHIFLHYLLLFI